MPSINTQPLSDAHDKIFTNVLNGLAQARTTALEWSGKFSARTADVAVLKELPKADKLINNSYDLVTKALTRQHDVTENLLAKTR